jgi:branched-chain amino acid transport system permease protein
MFFGAGGYGTALALTHVKGLGIVAALAIGVAAALVLAAILCPLMVRVSGNAFSMLHLAFGQLVYVLALKLRGITGGEDGVGGFPIPPLAIPGVGDVAMKDPTKFYYFAVVVLGASIWALWFVTKTPFPQCRLLATIITDSISAGPIGPRNPSATSRPLATSAVAAAVANRRPGLNPIVSKNAAVPAKPCPPNHPNHYLKE